MTNETRAHIRSILWQYKKIEKTFKEFSDIIEQIGILIWSTH